jgi:hypothetical protein
MTASPVVKFRAAVRIIASQHRQKVREDFHIVPAQILRCDLDIPFVPCDLGEIFLRGLGQLLYLHAVSAIDFARQQ